MHGEQHRHRHPNPLSIINLPAVLQGVEHKQDRGPTLA